MQNFLHLEWDSNFFGFKVARLVDTDFDESTLASLLRNLKEENYRLVYWFIPSEQKESARMARAYGGLHADEKVVFEKKLSKHESISSSSYKTTSYTNTKPDAALVELALQSGEYSRFRLDPSFPRETFERMYTCWITRSVLKEIAWQVLVVRDSADILGLITLGTKDSRGDIGLLAVSEHSRGKGIGKLLVNDAEKHFVEQGSGVSQVVTQRINTGACKLYESCGYRIEKIDNIFHFWL